MNKRKWSYDGEHKTRSKESDHSELITSIVDNVLINHGPTTTKLDRRILRIVNSLYRVGPYDPKESVLVEAIRDIWRGGYAALSDEDERICQFIVLAIYLYDTTRLLD